MKILERLWAETDAWPEYLRAMRFPFEEMGDQRGEGERGASLSRWSQLPQLCCAAAGGSMDQAQYLALGWQLFYLAADIMDSIQDGDKQEDWAEEIGPARTISVATGLYFSANLALNHMLLQVQSQPAVAEALGSFYASMLHMASGQHDDLSGGELTLERYWRRVGAKSGAFFSAASRGGARLATDDPGRLAAYEEFGKQVGILIQIADDLGEVNPDDPEDEPGQNPKFKNTLAVAYAQEVLPEAKRERLKTALLTAQENAEMAREVIALVDESFAAKYIRGEIEIRRLKAENLLEEAGATAPAKDELISLLAKF